ncbi:MAG: DPP IV N-terminal domain-containing protein [Anaerolineales bacterium]|jgi:Tol biopolymer transport system component
MKNQYRIGLALFAVLALTILAGCRSAPIGPAPTPERPPRIAFMSDRDGAFDIYIMDRDGGNLTNLTNHEAQDGIPEWSRNAASFVFISTRDSEEDVFIYRMDEDGANQRMMNPDVTSATAQYLWSPDGQWLAYEGGVETTLDVFIMDTSGGQVKNISESDAVDRLAPWSTDGEEILIVSNREGSSLAIYAVDIDSGEFRRLTDPAYNSGTPAWSPDGKKIAFMSDKDGAIEIYTMDNNGENLARLTESVEFDGYPAWSPDGSKIAFISNRDGNPEIYVMNADGGEQTNLTNTPEGQESIQGDFAWSPDGSQILFHSDRDGDVEVYVMEADGSNPTNLTNNPASDSASIWVP